MAHNHNSTLVTEEFINAYLEINIAIANHFEQATSSADKITLLTVSDKQISYSKALNAAVEDGSFTEDEAQYLNCSTCAQFYHKYGNIVIVDDEGNVKSIVWNIPEILEKHSKFKTFFNSLKTQVEKAKLKGPAYKLQKIHKNEITPNSEKGGFDHFSLKWKKNQTSICNIISINHFNENIQNVGHNLKHYYGEGILEKALFALKENPSIHFKRAREAIEKHIEIRDVIKELSKEQQVNKRRQIAAQYYPSVLQINNTSLGIVLDGIVNGNVEKAIKLFEKAVNPFNYQRTTRESDANAIEKAEEFIKDNDITLGRRYVDLSEIAEHILWKKEEVSTNDETSIFNKLTNAKKEENTSLRKKLEDVGYPYVCRNFETFIDLINEKDKVVNVFTFTNLQSSDVVTGSVSSNPKKMWVWETENDIQPFSWICKNIKSNLAQMQKVSIDAVIRHPGGWGVKECRYDGFVYVFDKETANKVLENYSSDLGIGLFSEILDGRFYAHRRTLEEYSNKEKLVKPLDIEHPVIGIVHSKGSTANVFVIEYEHKALIVSVNVDNVKFERNKIVDYVKRFIN